MNDRPQQESCECLICGRSHWKLGYPPWGLLTADQVRQRIKDRFPNWSHDAMAEELDLSAGFVGMVLAGTREPSKAILDAMGLERVSYYRRSSLVSSPEKTHEP